jgi:undecaprenyl diphosphate synthase
MGSNKENIDLKGLPRHVAIIMDGNGRWAKQQGNMRIFGHRKALRAVREVIEAGVDLGLGYITLFTFSTENWKRPQIEVRALMELLVSSIKKEMPTLMQNNIRLRAIGQIDDLPGRAKTKLLDAMEATKNNDGLVLTLALSYGGRADILTAINSLVDEAKKGSLHEAKISEATLRAHMSTHFLPDPELMIRTSGEFRISNFLLWELAYTEIHITPKFWPDFQREDLYAAILDFQKRERRFGMISEQLESL